MGYLAICKARAAMTGIFSVFCTIVFLCDNNQCEAQRQCAVDGYSQQCRLSETTEQCAMRVFEIVQHYGELQLQGSGQ